MGSFELSIPLLLSVVAIGTIATFTMGLAIWIAARIGGVRDATFLKSIVAAVLAVLLNTLTDAVLPTESFVITEVLEVLVYLVLVFAVFLGLVVVIVGVGRSIALGGEASGVASLAELARR